MVSFGNFKVEPHHLETGLLTTEEASAYAERPVKALALDSFPAAKEVLMSGKKAAGCKFSDYQSFLARGRAIMAEVGPYKNWPQLSFDDLVKEASAYEASEELREAYQDVLDAITRRSGALHFVPQDKFFDLNKELLTFEGGTLAKEMRLGAERVFLVRGHEEKQQIRLKKTSCLVAWPATLDPKAFYAEAMVVTPDQIDIALDPKLTALRSCLHELRHAAQAETLSVLGSAESRYYAELDADLFSLTALRETGSADADTKAFINMRYVAMMFADEAYCFAPALEASLEGGPLPERRKILRSVNYIGQKIRQERQGQWPSYFDVRLCECLYASSRKDGAYWKTLQALVDKDAFEKDEPLTQALAKRMVEAAAFFNPVWVGRPRRPEVKKLFAGARPKPC